MNSLIILRIFLWINRILGITFGGITIDDNSTIVVNKWLRLYGYSAIVMIIGLDIQFVYLLFDYTGDELKEFTKNLPDNTRSFMLNLLYITILAQLIFKVCAIIYFNVNSELVARLLVKNLNRNRNRSTNAILSIIMVLWLIASLFLIIMAFMSLGTFMNSSKGYLHPILSMSQFLMTMWSCWIITFACCIFSIIYNDRLEKIIWNLKHSVKLTKSVILSRKITLEAIESIKSEFIEIRREVSSVDSNLSFMIAFRILLSIYYLMIYAYNISLISIEPEMKLFLKINAFVTIISIIEMIFVCFICGSLHTKSSSVNTVLDDLSQNVLSDNECNQWLVLKNVCNNSEFGFTIGGFANLEKTTLIPVLIIIYLTIIINKINNNLFLFIDLHIYSELYSPSHSNVTIAAMYMQCIQSNNIQ